jgi:hypothetical protein
MSTSSAVRAHRREPAKAVAKLTAVTLPPSTVGTKRKRTLGPTGTGKRKDSDHITLQTFEETDFVVINGVYATSLRPGGGPVAADPETPSASEVAAASAAGSLYRALRPDRETPSQEDADWSAQVVCVDAEFSTCLMLRLPLVLREPMIDENAIGMLFALGLEQSPLDTPGCPGPRIDAGRLASVTLVQNMRGRQSTKKQSSVARVRTRASTTLSTVCPKDCVPHCVAIHWEHRALCSLLLPLHEPLKDVDEHFWALEVRAVKRASTLNLFFSNLVR